MAVADPAARVGGSRPRWAKSEAVALALQKYWREEVSGWPPGRREVWLKTPEAIVALGSRRVKDMLAGIRHTRQGLQASVASAAWIEIWESRGELPPFHDSFHQGLGLNWRGEWRYSAVYSSNDAVRFRDGYFLAHEVVRGLSPAAAPGIWMPTPARQFAARMVLSECYTAIGAGAWNRRWTPPQAVDVEDFLDSMSEREADLYQFPASPSVVVIRRVGEMRGVEV